MCVAINKPAGATIPKKVLEACFKQNDDGAGFAVNVVRDGKTQVEVYKGFFTFGGFWNAWKEWGPEFQAILHFRVATHGRVNEENCHPFLTKTQDGRTMALVHNGMLADFERYSSNERSDSRAFVETAIGPLYKKFPKLLKNRALLGLIERGISYNKIIMLENDGTVAILNKLAGTEHDFENGEPKVWFSNGMWKSQLDGRPAVCAVPPSYGGYSGDTDEAYEAYQEGMMWSGPEAKKALEVAKEAVKTEPIVETKKPPLMLPAKVNPPTNTTPIGIFKVKPNVPKQEVTRTNERRSLHDREFWEDGFRDAYAGIPLVMSSCTPAYERGFMSAIEDLARPTKEGGSVEFSMGYVDFMNKNPKQTFTAQYKQNLYSAGFYWAMHNTLTSKETRDVRGNASDDSSVAGDVRTGNGASGAVADAGGTSGGMDALGASRLLRN